MANEETSQEPIMTQISIESSSSDNQSTSEENHTVKLPDPRKEMLEYLGEKLNVFYDSKVQGSLHRKAEYEDFVYDVVHKIIRKIQTVDSRFRANSLVSLGMPYDGIHDDGKQTCFEMMLQLSVGSNNSLFLHRDKSGLSTRIQLMPDNNLWEDCMETNSHCISPKLVIRTLRKYVKRVVYVLRKYIDSNRMDKIPENLISIELEKDNKNQVLLCINQNIFVLLLPSISIPDCRTDMSRKDIPSSSHVVAACRDYKNFAVQKDKIMLDENNNTIDPSDFDIKEKSVISEDQNYSSVVALNTHSQFSIERSLKIVWKFSFFVAEKNKMRALNDGCRIKLLRILTEIRDSEPRLQLLSSYHLQAMFFHETDRLQRRRDWKDSKIANRFLDLLRTASKHLENGLCANYFMHPPDYPNVNLFEDIPLEDLNDMKKVVDDIREDPVSVLSNDDIERNTEANEDIE